MYHKTVQDWNELMAEFDENGFIDKERLEAFRQSHEKHLSGYYFVIKDLLKENRRKFDSTEEKQAPAWMCLKVVETLYSSVVSEQMVRTAKGQPLKQG